MHRDALALLVIFIAIVALTLVGLVLLSSFGA